MGAGPSVSSQAISRAFGRSLAITSTAIHGVSSAMLETEFDTSTPNRLIWRVARSPRLSMRHHRQKPCIRRSGLARPPAGPARRCPAERRKMATRRNAAIPSRRSQRPRVMLTVSSSKGLRPTDFRCTAGRQVRTARSDRRLFRLDRALGGPLFLVAGGSGIAPINVHAAVPRGGIMHNSSDGALFIADLRGHHLSPGVGSDGRA